MCRYIVDLLRLHGDRVLLVQEKCRGVGAVAVEADSGKYVQTSRNASTYLLMLLLQTFLVQMFACIECPKTNSLLFFSL